MFCQQCGQQNDDNAAYCGRCGRQLDSAAGQPQQAGAAAPAQPIQTYLVPAILVTIFCCMPFGVVAIVFAAQASSKLNVGDFAGAQDSSEKAKIWCIVAAALGLVSYLPFMLYMLLITLGIAAGGLAGM